MEILAFSSCLYLYFGQILASTYTKPQIDKHSANITWKYWHLVAVNVLDIQHMWVTHTAYRPINNDNN